MLLVLTSIGSLKNFLAVVTMGGLEESPFQIFNHHLPTFSSSQHNTPALRITTTACLEVVLLALALRF